MAKRYDHHHHPQAEFEMDGMFLNLQVPGLMEGRPSLILGDRLIVSKNENLLSGKVSYMGSVHQVVVIFI